MVLEESGRLLFCLVGTGRSSPEVKQPKPLANLLPPSSADMSEWVEHSLHVPWVTSCHSAWT
jgi:hypothetical protein